MTCTWGSRQKFCVDCAAVNTPDYYGLVSTVPGRTPDLIIVPQPGVVYASPTAKKIAEHGGLMMSDENVALLVAAPNLSPGSAGSVYPAVVSLLFPPASHHEELHH